MSAKCKHIVGLFLLLVFVAYITPKEMIHAFTHHHDTQHSAITEKGGLSISGEHHHCELMKLDQQFSAHEIQIPYYCFSKGVIYYNLPCRLFKSSIECGNIASIKQLRAPPFVLS